jgi:hypothetical protein
MIKLKLKKLFGLIPPVSFIRSSLLKFCIFIMLLSGNLSYKIFAQEKITSPEEFFGFQMGADYKLARWDKITEYFYLLEKQSDKLKVMDLGPSSEGHPFLVLLISSPENLSNLERLQYINKRINDPENLSEDSLNRYIDEGKAVVMQSMSLHASEVGGTQMSTELTWDLLTRKDEDCQRILDNVLFFMIPCFNPDGQVMITDWYNETVGTEYEGVGMPWLYHKYCGHDNNRDGDYLNLQESKYTARLMYIDWQPQAYIDHHHMGSYGARFYVPPYCDPIRPYADPLIWRELSWYGAHIAYKLEEEGFRGVLNAAQFSGWGHFGWHWITLFHNIAGMLTESATVNYASPVYIHPEQLTANTRMFPEYEAQSTFPNPWQGGWWRLRDIVAQQKSSAISLLDLVAKNKKTVLKTAYIKANNQITRGKEDKIKTLIIPARQHDYLTSVKMVNILLQSGIKIFKAEEDFTSGSKNYEKGSYLIPMAQPKMGLIKNLLTEIHYFDNYWTRNNNNSPLRPYDLATHTMYEFMGVTVEESEYETDGKLTLLKGVDPVKGTVEKGAAGYRTDGRQNAGFRAVNILLDRNVAIKRANKKYGPLNPGDFIIEQAREDILKKVAEETGVSFKPLQQFDEDNTHIVKRGRIGLFQRCYGGNMDEGWTRLCFENFDFKYNTLLSEEIKAGNLNKNYEVIVIPNDSRLHILGNYSDNSSIRPEDYPEKYRSGTGEEGTEAIKKFVENGGTLVTFGSSYDFAADAFDLKIRNVTAGLSDTEYFCPGSTLKVEFDNTHPLAYGMPEEGFVLNFSSPVFVVTPGRYNQDYTPIVRYKDENILKSGWLLGEDHITGKPGMVKVDYGKGEIVLIGFRTQHRDQTDGTFKLLFNTIIR